MRITLTIPSLAFGGAERVLTILANAWIARGWEVTLISLNDSAWASFFELDPHVHWIRLGLLKEVANPLAGLWNNFLRVRALRKAIRKSNPQVVISFIETMNVLTLVAIRDLNIPIIISERTDPAKHRIGPVWNCLRTLLYPSACRLVVICNNNQAFFKPLLAERVCTIPNPIFPPPVVQGETPFLPQRPFVIAAGRLSHEKGHDLLIRAFARLGDHHPDWNLVILGEGSQRSELERLVFEFRLGERVFLPGRVKNPYDYYLKADLFVLPSRYEGFGNVLGEAMACGMPVVAANCSPGVAEVVQDGVNGLLAEPDDVDSLTAAMDNLMSDIGRRANLGEQARLTSERFSLDSVMTLWENLIRELTTI
jgi:glycosyltransferase involved in cell wall biosynthesis